MVVRTGSRVAPAEIQWLVPYTKAGTLSTRTLLSVTWASWIVLKLLSEVNYWHAQTMQWS